jgi:hypothetical protein
MEPGLRMDQKTRIHHRVQVPATEQISLEVVSGCQDSPDGVLTEPISKNTDVTLEMGHLFQSPCSLGELDWQRVDGSGYIQK